MEIYSYVGTSCSSSKKRLSVPAFSLPAFPGKYKRREAAFEFESRREKINWRLLLKKIGENTGLISAVLAGIVSVSAASWGISKLTSYNESHTNPLIIEDENGEDLALLNKAMASFAMETSEEADADGNISNVENLNIFQGPVTFQTYTVKAGETVSSITRKFSLQNISTVIAVNNISNVRSVYSGQKLSIPSCDGLIHTVQSGNTIQGISSKYQVSVEDILDANDLDSEKLTQGMKLFIPGAKLDRETLKKAMGDTWISPLTVKWRLTSLFGTRSDPFTGVRQYHNGYDMACPSGSPILAVLDGKVVASGWSNLYGNYVIIDHGNGYQSLYGHMLKRLCASGERVSRGAKIGLVGSTGYSTGAHLHFTVYKNGKPVDPKSVVKGI